MEKFLHLHVAINVVIVALVLGVPLNVITSAVQTISIILI